MNKKLSTVLALASLSISAAASGHAQELDVLDRDGNGSITLYEALADPKVSALFVDLDVDQNGSVDRREMQFMDVVAKTREMATEQACLH